MFVGYVLAQVSIMSLSCTQCSCYITDTRWICFGENATCGLPLWGSDLLGCRLNVLWLRSFLWCNDGNPLLNWYHRSCEFRKTRSRVWNNIHVIAFLPRCNPDSVFLLHTKRASSPVSRPMVVLTPKHRHHVQRQQFKQWLW